MMIAKPIGGLVLLAGLCLAACQVGAKSLTSCVPGLKRLLHLKPGSSSDSSYATLAERLHSATPSDELGDNIVAARSLLEQLANEPKPKKETNLRNLMTAFSSLEAGDDNERLCGATNMANLRPMAEAMQRAGNLGPYKVSEPIRRLNHILIKLIARARTVCFAYLDSKWPAQSPPESLKTSIWQQRSNRVIETFSTKSYLLDHGPVYVYDEKRLGKSLAIILELSALEEAKQSQSGTGAFEQASSRDTKTIVKHFEHFIMRPCDELQSLAISNSILKPYFDLIVANQIINWRQTDLLKEFYKNKGEKPSIELVLNSKDVLHSAYQMRTCAILSQMDRERLAKLIAGDRLSTQPDPYLSYALHSGDDDEDDDSDSDDDDDDDEQHGNIVLGSMMIGG